MRQSEMLLPTLRESPADAEAASHKLLVRAGYIRQTAAGVYTYLPLGRRVLRKVENIVREEMERTGAQELLMPALQPAELWRESGRYDVYGPELVRLHDRHGREFALGPTHEEVVTSIVRAEISSYRQLPQTLYQIQTKFRDERRPRFGLLRGREFLMKDAYSFDTDWEGLDRTYRRMFAAYERLLDRIGLKFRAVEADAGAIGGEGATHEFMALADIGEDMIAVCPACEYASNLEKTESAAASPSENSDNAVPKPDKICTPEARTIDEVASFLQTEPEMLIKTLIYLIDGQPAAVLVRGDHEVNELKLKAAAGAASVEIANHETVQRATGAPAGFAGPIGLSIPIYVDFAVAAMPEGIAGANEADHHVRHVVPGRDFPLDNTGDFRIACEGDACPRCGEGRLQMVKGIEVGHVFKLGTKYSEALGASYLDADGRSHPMIMGCYGIGVSRLLAAVAEQHHDEHGFVWPAAVAPYAVHIIPAAIRDEAQRDIAAKLCERLTEAGVETLLDDRDERAGVKFKDSDLIGIPYRIVVGRRAAEGVVEWVERRGLAKEEVTIEEAVRRIEDRV